MAQKEVEQKPGLDLIQRGSATLEKLRGQRQALSPEMYKAAEDLEKLVGKKATKTSMEQAQQQMSKLDEGLENYRQYKQTIADLAAGLQETLNEYLTFAQKSMTYQGVGERFLAILPFERTKRIADRKRNQRILQQDPRENLKLFLDYGEELFKEICEIRADALTTFERLSLSVELVVTKIAEYQPQEEELKEQLSALEAQFREADARYKTASPAEQAKMIGALNEQRKRLTDVRNRYDQVFTVYKQAQETLQANIESRSAFEQIVRDLGVQATMVKEKVEDVTEIYRAAPEALKAMMTTKGMEAFDQAINTATERSVDMITLAAEGIADTTMRRVETPVIPDETMAAYIQRMGEMARKLEQRFVQVRASAQRSQAERYSQQEQAQ